MTQLRINFIVLVFYLIAIFLPLTLFSQTSAAVTERWIDKDENEQYTARHECSFVQAGNRFIMFGGRESAKRLDIYDYVRDGWSVGSEAPKEFNHFQATFFKGFIWVIGSFKTNTFPKELPEENVWLYHAALNVWIKGPEIPAGRRRGGAGLVVYQDKFYLLGGNTIGHNGGYVSWFDSYDPKTNRWTVLQDASQARDHFHAVVIDKTLYAAGGRQSGGEGGMFAPLISAVDVYNFDTKVWSVLEKALPTPRAAPCTFVFNDRLHVAGGEGEARGPAYKLTEAYDPATGSWSRKDDMNYARHGTQAIVSGDGVYIAGGSPVRGGGRQLNMEVYHQDTPSGMPLVASDLQGPSKIMINTGSTQKLSLENKGGNTGTFINKVEIKGLGKDRFKVLSSVDLTLVDAGGPLEINIQHLGKTKDDRADLHITYNGDLEKVIGLASK